MKTLDISSVNATGENKMHELIINEETQTGTATHCQVCKMRDAYYKIFLENDQSPTYLYACTTCAETLVNVYRANRVTINPYLGADNDQNRTS